MKRIIIRPDKFKQKDLNKNCFTGRKKGAISITPLSIFPQSIGFYFDFRLE